MSRKHAAIVRQRGGFLLKDMGSTRGTFVNGQKLTHPALLQDGQTIQIGEVLLIFSSRFVQIQDGDIIRHLKQYKDYISHIHTAGNPGRGELDNKQEINYPPIMQKLLDIGYAGTVGQEFIPTRDPLAGLQQAVKLCDV